MPKLHELHSKPYGLAHDKNIVFRLDYSTAQVVTNPQKHIHFNVVLLNLHAAVAIAKSKLLCFSSPQKTQNEHNNR